MMKGAKLIADAHLSAMKKKVPIYRNVKNLRAEGEERLTQVTATSGSKELSFDATTLLLSHHRLRPPKSLPFIFIVLLFPANFHHLHLPFLPSPQSSSDDGG